MGNLVYCCLDRSLVSSGHCSYMQVALCGYVILINVSDRGISSVFCVYYVNGETATSLELPLDTDQATKFLDEHDLHDVLNKMPDEAFDLLTGMFYVQLLRDYKFPLLK